MDQELFSTALELFDAYLDEHVPDISRLTNAYIHTFGKTECTPGSFHAFADDEN